MIITLKNNLIQPEQEQQIINQEECKVEEMTLNNQKQEHYSSLQFEKVIVSQRFLETKEKLLTIKQFETKRLLSGQIPILLQIEAKSGLLKEETFKADRVDIKQFLECLDQNDQDIFKFFTENNSFHRAHEDFANRKIMIFITQILNPILKACDIYEKQCQNSDESLRWWNKNQNIIADAHLRQIQECLSQKQKQSQQNQKQQVQNEVVQIKKNTEREQEEKAVEAANYVQQNIAQEEDKISDRSTESVDHRNQLYILKNINYQKFKVYAKIMFNNQQKKELKDNKIYMNLVKKIDDAAEDLKMPRYLSKHIKSYYWDKNRHVREINSEEKPTFNRKCLLQLLLIALSDKDPVPLDYDIIKNEVARLSFVGDQTINLACVMNMIFSGAGELQEKDFDHNKNKIINKENLKKAAENFGLKFFFIKAKFSKTPPKNDQKSIENDQKERSLSDIVQALAGYFAIYIGFNAAFLFLADLGILKSDQTLDVGDTSIDSKISILKELSENRKNFLNTQSKAKQETLLNLTVDLAEKVMSPAALNLSSDEYSTPDFNRNLSLLDLQIGKASKCLEQTSLFQITKAMRPLDDDLVQSVSSSLEEKAYIKMDEKEAQAMQYVNKTSDTLQSQNHNKNDKKDKMFEMGDVEEELQMKKNDQLQPQEESKQNNGFKFKNKGLLVQAFVHKSFSERLINSKDQILAGNQQAEKYLQILNDKNMMINYNYEILEYLGDSFLNFTVSKLFYFETAQQQQTWHATYFVPQKLHELKTWFTSNHWLSFVIYENFFFTLLTDTSGQFIIERESLLKLIHEVRKMKDTDENDPALKKLLQKAPRLPLLYDEQNLKFHLEICEFQSKLFKICCFNCPEMYLLSSQQNSDIQESKALSLSSFIEIDRKEEEDENFYQIQEKFVKYFSDALEAIIGSIFLDSGDFEKAQVLTLRLLSSNLINKFPIKEQQRTKVLAIWNSKKYTNGIKLTHSIEEKDDNLYIKGYMNQMEVRRVKFSKDKKKKIPKFYQDFQLYLEESYSKFEEMQIKKGSAEVGAMQFLEFNKDFRKSFKSSSKSTSKKIEYSIIKEASRRLYLKYIKQIWLGISQIQEIRKELESVLNQGFIDAKYSDSSIQSQILILEQERVRSSKIREFFNRCEIKSINTTAIGIKTFKDFIARLPDKQAYFFYYRMLELAEQLVEDSRKLPTIGKPKQVEAEDKQIQQIGVI